MGKKIFEVYLAKEDVPNNEAYAKLDLPASLWELWDALDKVRLQTDDILYMEIEGYDAFEYLSPHLDGLDISINELNDLASLLSALDEVQEAAFEGLFSMEVQRKVNANGGVITLQDLRDLAVSAKTDCYHVVDAADDAQLGCFYAENGFIPELDGVSDAVFKMLDFAGIGRMMRCSENGVFVGNLYVLQDGELTTAPPVQKTLPEKPGYLFRLTLGLHPDIGDARTVTLDLPAAEAELLDAQEQLGVEGWEGVTVIDYDGIIPYAAEFTDLPMELEELNAFTKAARDIPRSEVPKLKALLEQFEVQDIETAMLLTEHLADYILTPGISSPQEAALDQLCFIMLRTQIPARSQWHWSHSTVCGRRAIPSRHTSWERHIRTGLAYRLTEKRRQSGFKNRRRPVILALHMRWANCCWSRSNSRRPFTGCGRQRSRTIHMHNTGSASCCSPAQRVCQRM